MSSVDTSLCKSQLAHVLIECADPALVLIFLKFYTLRQWKIDYVFSHKHTKNST